MDINLMLASCQNDKLPLSDMPLISHELPCLPFKIHNNAARSDIWRVPENDHRRAEQSKWGQSTNRCRMICAPQLKFTSRCHHYHDQHRHQQQYHPHNHSVQAMNMNNCLSSLASKCHDLVPIYHRWLGECRSNARARGAFVKQKMASRELSE